MEPKELNGELGNSDILLIDQILKNRFSPDMKILDAGCGEGRNLTYFIRNGYCIYGIDNDPDAIRMAGIISGSVNRNFVKENLLTCSIEDNPFPDQFFDVVLCINVLHDAASKEHFEQMIRSLHRILRKEGMVFLSMASEFCHQGRTNSSSVKNRFLLNDRIMKALEIYFYLGQVEPIRTIHIEGRECLTYVILTRKGI